MAIIGKFLKKTRLKFILWFLLRFNLLSIPLYIAIYTGLSFLPMQIFLAQVTTEILKAQDYNLVQSEQMIVVNADNSFYTIEVSWDSTGWKSLYALFALVVAVPAINMTDKLRFLSIGLPTIFILNLIRITTTILVALNLGFQYFDIVHTILWREGLILAVVLLWYFWVRGKGL